MLTGKKFGRYEVSRQIGAGGMGEVYQAQDTELNRSVALKILSDEFSSDESRQKRFLQEARAASALNHPNIITIYETGKSEYGAFIATEFIDGETLRDTLKRTPISVLRALKITEQVADALAAAHEAHIVHRDIKPENIMVRRDGYIKVLDFGLAKPILDEKYDLGDANLPVFNTLPGMIVGSVRYMSPEQARALPLDSRTDIWSLGVVLYEMLTGHAPFKGSSAGDTIASVIYQEPHPLSFYGINAPPELQRIIRRVLQKDRDERYQNIKDFALDLKGVLYEIEHEINSENNTEMLPVYAGHSGETARIHQTSGANHTTQNNSVQISSAEFIIEQVRRNKWQTIFASIGTVLILSAIAFGFYHWFSTTPVNTINVFDKPQISRISTDGKVRLPAISPDGKYVAYLSGEVGARSLVVRQIATDSVVTIAAPTALDFKGVSFSPDGNYVYYVQLTKNYSIGTLYQIPTLGGTPKKIIEDVDSNVTFSPDGKRLAFLRHLPQQGTDSIFVANADGSNPQQLINTKQTEFKFFINPAWSPDGAKLLVGTGTGMDEKLDGIVLAEIAVADGAIKLFNQKKWKRIADFCWVKDGSGILLTARESEQGATQIWRVAYPSGEFYPITNDLNDYFNLDVSADGNTLISIKSDAVSTVWSFSPSSKELNQIISETRNMEGEAGIAEMPDGKLILSKRDDKKLHLWSVGADGNNPFQLTNDSGFDTSPAITPDGRFIVFTSNRSGSSRLWRMNADGKNPIQLTEENKANGDYEAQLTPDGKNVIFQRFSHADGKHALMKISLDGGAVVPILESDENVNFIPRLSPDGKHLAFVSFNTVNFKKILNVVSFDGEKIGQTEKEFDYELIADFRWSPDSKSLTYHSAEGVPNLWKLPLDGGKPQRITDFKSGRIFNFAWSNDGKRLHIVRGTVNNDLVIFRDTLRSAAL